MPELGKSIYWVHCGTFDFPTDFGSQLIEFPGNEQDFFSYIAPALQGQNSELRKRLQYIFTALDWSYNYSPFPGSKGENPLEPLFQIEACDPASLTPVDDNFYLN